MKPTATAPSQRTTFCLPNTAHQAIKMISEIKGQNLKTCFEFLITMITPGEQHYKEVAHAVKSMDKSSYTRKTYVIDADVKNRLQKHARIQNLSRDELIIICITILSEKLAELKLSVKEKIEHANKIIKAAELALHEWNKCHESLAAIGDDKEFSIVNEYIAYIGQLNELPIYVQEYIDKISSKK
ncbi:MAG: hypothetical protein FWG17_05070 [Desulfovibrionaceae bacterium]|nr:hypothetical protein [Desulfovibrionaceae bacterium]